jgi:CRP-like cAMP-binding protein
MLEQESRIAPPAHSVLAHFIAEPQLAARRVTLARGQVLFEPQDAAQWLHFVHRGQVRTYQVVPSRGERLLEVLGRDQWCGGAVFGRAEVYGEQAVAVTAATVSQIPADRLFAVLPRHSEVMVALLQQFHLKLSTAREDAAAMVFEDTRRRLVRALLRFSRSAAAAPHPAGVALRMTHRDLAQAVGAARETVSDALTEFRRNNLLKTGRNQVLFNPEVLAAAEKTLRLRAAQA